LNEKSPNCNFLAIICDAISWPVWTRAKTMVFEARFNPRLFY
jgi:hypothetical protein